MRTLGAEINERLVEELVEASAPDVPSGYEPTIGLTVWWVGDCPYPTKAAACKVGSRIDNIYGDRPNIFSTIETPGTLREAIEQRKADRRERRKNGCS